MDIETGPEAYLALGISQLIDAQDTAEPQTSIS